ncbi:MAG: hypothetical protein HY877_06715 [Deltaproteobacteria bacterium]|nr:hypothetical protein [Deltaproteobacteria bacterium]
MKKKMFSRKSFLLIAICFVSFLTSSAWGALTTGATYSVVLSKVNSDGSTTDVTSTTAVADSNGKISFSFSSIPTNSDANFLAVTVKGPTADASGRATPDTQNTIVRQGLSPAPSPGVTNLTGVNDMSYTQSQALLQGFSAGGSADPVFAAFGLMLLRVANMSASDISNIASGGRAAILGTGGLVDFIQTNGVTAAQMTTFKQKLVYNKPGKLDFSDFTSKYKDAVDNSTTATTNLAEAASMMADIFIDAANAAGIDLDLIMAGMDAAGGIAESNANLLAVSTTTSSSMNQSVNSFMTRIAATKVKQIYSDALTTLSATGSQVTRFNTGVSNMVTSFSAIDSTYGKYYENPVANPMTATIQAAINAAYQTGFNTFMSDIASTNAEITTMKSAVASAFGITVGQLPAGYGTYTNETGTVVNFPIPQAVSQTWVANNIQATGGSLTYTRDTLEIPSNMQSWLPARNDYVAQGFPASFAALLGLQEDVMIIQSTKFNLFSGGTQPTLAQKQAAELLYHQRLDARAAALGGTTNGSTAISSAQKDALVLMSLQPSLH